eukprot:595964-Lingulodinium_polyedra.AAC.1
MTAKWARDDKQKTRHIHVTRATHAATPTHGEGVKARKSGGSHSLLPNTLGKKRGHGYCYDV